MKLRLHVYICRRCGMGKVNAQDARGNWFATFHRPDGTSERSARVPPCEVGPKTDLYLRAYADAL